MSIKIKLSGLFKNKKNCVYIDLFEMDAYFFIKFKLDETKTVNRGLGR